MKKYLFMAMAAFAFVSCSNDFDASGAATNEKGTPINFDVYAGGTSRGSVTDITALEQAPASGGGIKVIINNAGTTSIYENFDLSYNATSWNAGNHFWPANNLDFFFYAPARALTTLPSPNVAIAAADFQTATYTYYQPAAPSAQQDILYSAPTLNQPSTSNAIPINLNHVMSRINFKVLSGPNNTTGVQVTSIKLRGRFNVQGKMNFGALNSTQFWSDTLSTDTCYSPLPLTTTFTDKETAAELLQAGEEMYIIPSDETTYQLEVTYNCQNNIWTKSVPVGPIEFEVGKSYVITVVLDVDLIRFSVGEIGEWTSGTVNASY